VPALASRSDTVVETGLSYAPGDPVLVHVQHRDQRTTVTDDGGAVARAGRRRGWRDVADRLADGFVVNVTRSGVVCLPVVPVGPPEDVVVRRIGEASLALYQDLLELDG
jgi:hypothetical protein